MDTENSAGPSGPDPEFAGRIGRIVDDSEPWWPAPPSPPGDSPNIVVIVLDDTGFAHLGSYGSTLATPNMDRLAAGGIRYTGFHTTALCSPSRAALLTGRNHHTVGMRGISNWDTGYPHMRGAVTRRAAMLPEILSDHGYATYAVGKWHLAPMVECSAAGPHDNWPLQRGFDRYYGFLQGETDQFHPELTVDNHHIDPPATPEQGYHLSEDLVDHSIEMIDDLNAVLPERPFLLWLAFGATHSPHQAPAEYLERWRGRFDDGWDEARRTWFERQQQMGIVPPGTRLADRNRGVLPWDELSDDERLFAARLQEAFAAFLEHTDDQIGRLVTHLETIGKLDDTMIVLLSDNGASQEGGQHGVMDEMKYFNGMTEDVASIVAHRLDEIGGPHSHTNFPWGWAQAGNTPLRWYKQNTHGGGIRDPLIIHWPNRIADRGAIRHQFAHVSDLLPTVLDITGIVAPDRVGEYDQLPITGHSLVPTFDDADHRPEPRTQYFEMLGHRGIWVDGWKAVTRHRLRDAFDDDRWELYHLDEDFSEIDDRAATEPERLKAMIDLWWSEAETHGVLPLDGRINQLFAAPARPGSPHAGGRYVYRPPISHLPSDVAPPTGARPWSAVADIEIPAETNGVIFARGGHGSGLVLYLNNGLPTFHYNAFGHHHVLASPGALPEGRHLLGLRFERAGEGGRFVMSTGRPDTEPSDVASMEIDSVIRILSSIGMDIGCDRLSPVSEAYLAPAPFEGTIHTVSFEVKRGRSAADVEAQARRDLSQQ